MTASLQALRQHADTLPPALQQRYLEPDAADHLVEVVLSATDGDALYRTGAQLAFQLDAWHDRVLRLGGRLLPDRSDDPEDPLRVHSDPAGNPFRIFVA